MNSLLNFFFQKSRWKWRKIDWRGGGENPGSQKHSVIVCVYGGRGEVVEGRRGSCTGQSVQGPGLDNNGWAS